MIYQTALTLHIIGIVLFAGAAFIDFFISKQFWKIYAIDKNNVHPVAMIINKIQRITGLGGQLILPSGIIMIYMNRFWAQQTWFQVKMGMLLIVLINAAVFRRKFGRSLTLLISGNKPGISEANLRSNLNRVQLIQIALLTIMFTLSVFKFN